MTGTSCPTRDQGRCWLSLPLSVVGHTWVFQAWVLTLPVSARHGAHKCSQRRPLHLTSASSFPSGFLEVAVKFMASIAGSHNSPLNKGLKASNYFAMCCRCGGYKVLCSLHRDGLGRRVITYCY